MEQWASLTDLIWPIDSVYFSDVNTGLNPAEVFGGVWILCGTKNINGFMCNVYYRQAYTVSS